MSDPIKKMEQEIKKFFQSSGIDTVQWVNEKGQVQKEMKIPKKKAKASPAQKLKKAMDETFGSKLSKSQAANKATAKKVKDALEKGVEKLKKAGITKTGQMAKEKTMSQNQNPWRKSSTGNGYTADLAGGLRVRATSDGVVLKDNVWGKVIEPADFQKKVEEKIAAKKAEIAALEKSLTDLPILLQGPTEEQKASAPASYGAAPSSYDDEGTGDEE